MLLNNKFPLSNVMKKSYENIIIENFCEYAHSVSDDPVPSSDFTVLHCLGTGLPVYGIKSDQIRKYLSKIWPMPNHLNAEH